jgi:hypothetical protein
MGQVSGYGLEVYIDTSRVNVAGDTFIFTGLSEVVKFRLKLKGGAV